MTKPTLICVDDEAIILMSLKMELTNMYSGKFRYETAINGEEALEIIKELEQENQSVAVVITDWMMPGLNGDQLLEEVFRINPDIKGIMITGQAEDDIIEKVKSLPNVLMVINKPWREDQLREALDSIQLSEL